MTHGSRPARRSAGGTSAGGRGTPWDAACAIAAMCAGVVLILIAAGAVLGPLLVGDDDPPLPIA